MKSIEQQPAYKHVDSWHARSHLWNLTTWRFVCGALAVICHSGLNWLRQFLLLCQDSRMFCAGWWMFFLAFSSILRSRLAPCAEDLKSVPQGDRSWGLAYQVVRPIIALLTLPVTGFNCYISHDISHSRRHLAGEFSADPGADFPGPGLTLLPTSWYPRINCFLLRASTSSFWTQRFMIVPTS